MVNDGWWLVHWLVGATYPSEKWWSESQLGWWHSIPNWMERHNPFHGSSHHQPVQTSHLPHVHLRIPCPEFHPSVLQELPDGRLTTGCSWWSTKSPGTAEVLQNWEPKDFMTDPPLVPFQWVDSPNYGHKSNSWASEPTSIPTVSFWGTLPTRFHDVHGKMDHSSHKNPEISSWSTQGAGQKDISRCGKNCRIDWKRSSQTLRSTKSGIQRNTLWPLQGGAPKIAFSWFISGLTMVFMVDITMVNGGYNGL